MASYTALLFDPLSSKPKRIIIQRNKDGSSLESLQQFVEGFIEVLPHLKEESKWLAYVNEDGTNLAPNFMAWSVLRELGFSTTSRIKGAHVGPVVLCRVNEVGEEVSFNHRDFKEVDQALYASLDWMDD